MSHSPKRRIPWFTLHGWLAVPVWFLLTLICVTGTVLTIAYEVQGLWDPAVLAGPAEDRPEQPLNAILAAAAAATPDGIVTALGRRDLHLAYEATVSLPDAPEARAFINPYTAAVQGISLGPGFTGTLLALHGWLLFPGDFTTLGWYAVTALALPMLGATLTGLFVYRRFWTALIRPRLRLTAGARVFWGDLHRVGGVWGLWFALLMAITGLWFFTAAVLAANGVRIFPPPKPVATRDAPDRLPDADAALAAVRAAAPGFRLHYLTLPTQPGQALVLFGDRGTALTGKYGHRFFLHPQTLEITAAITPQGMTALQTTARAMGSLHFGNFGGPLTKTVWTLGGVLLSASLIGGGIVWLHRTARPKAGDRGWGRLPGVVLLPLLVVPVLSLGSYASGRTDAVPHGIALPRQPLGPHSVTLWLETEADGSSGVVAVLSPAAARSARTVTVQRDGGKAVALRGPPYRLRGTLRPAAGSGAVTLTLETRDGSRFSAVWPPAN